MEISLIIQALRLAFDGVKAVKEHGSKTDQAKVGKELERFVKLATPEEINRYGTGRKGAAKKGVTFAKKKSTTKRVRKKTVVTKKKG